jgi:CheY-like chemotaxis protein
MRALDLRAEGLWTVSLRLAWFSNVLLPPGETRRRSIMSTVINRVLTRPAEILLVEDNPGDVRLTQEAFRMGKILVNMHIVGDGVAAIDFLRRRGRYAEVPRPNLILLDLNLPRMDGREVLKEIKEDPKLKVIPVVVLTTARDEEEVLRAYGLNANAYITKPVEVSKFVEVVKTLHTFWFVVVTLPSEG